MLNPSLWKSRRCLSTLRGPQGIGELIHYSLSRNRAIVYQTVTKKSLVSSAFQCTRCLVQNGNGIEQNAVGLHFEPYRWRPQACGVTGDSSRTVVVIKLRRSWANLRPSSGSKKEKCGVSEPVQTFNRGFKFIKFV